MSDIMKHTHRVPVGPYGRLSDYKQLGGRFDSCEAQLEGCRELIQRRSAEGWYEEESFVDRAYSGKNMERPRMRALKEAIVAGRIKVVVIYKLERVLRSTDEWSSFRAFLKLHNCRLESVSEGEAEDTAAGRLKSNIIVSVAEYERLNLGEKVANKMLRQAQRGIWNGGLVPFGYIYDLKEKMLRPDPIEAPLVRYLFAQAEKLISLTVLAEELNAKSLRTRKRIFTSRDGSKREVGGRRFRSDWLRAMIRNPIYRGVIRYKGKEYPGQHEALVSVEVSESAIAAVNQTLKPAFCQSLSVGRDCNFNLLKGLAVCGSCNRALVPQAGGKLDPEGRPYRYYTCSAVLRERSDSTCPLRRVSAVGLERSLVGLLGQLSKHPSVVEAVLAAGSSGNPGRIVGLKKRLAVLGGEIDRVTKRMQNLFDTLARGGLEAIDDELREQATEWKARKATLLVERAQIQETLAGMQQAQLAPEKICSALENFDRLWEGIPPEEKREVAMLLIAKVEVHPAAEPASPSKAKARALKLRVTLHLPALLGAGSSSSVASKNRDVAIDAGVLLLGNSGEVVITTPFRHYIAAPTSSARKPRKSVAKETTHCIGRALALERALKEDPTLSPKALASREGLSPATVSQLRKLTTLCPAVQQALQEIDDRAMAWRCSIRRLLPLIGLPPAAQWAKFDQIRTSRRTRRARSADHGKRSK